MKDYPQEKIFAYYICDIDMRFTQKFLKSLIPQQQKDQRICRENLKKYIFSKEILRIWKHAQYH